MLPRRTITEKETTTYANTRASANTISYGYEPAEIAFALRELNHNVLTKATQGVDRKTLRLTEDMLSGFSCVLGWYNLCCFLLQPTPKEPDIHWLQKFYDLSVSHASLEFNTDHVVSWLAKHLPPRSEPAPDIPCWFAWNGTSYNEEFTAGTIIAAEKNRLLAFRKSLYMYLTVVTSRSKH